MVTELCPAAIVPVSVPPSVPVPVARLSWTPVAVVTGDAVPADVWDCTVALNVLPAVGLVGLMEVIASFVGGGVATTNGAVAVLSASLVVPLHGAAVFSHRWTVTAKFDVPNGVDPFVATLKFNVWTAPSPGTTV